MNEQKLSRDNRHATRLAGLRWALLVLLGGAALLFGWQLHAARAAQAEAYFVLEVTPRKDTFIIKLTDPAKIQRARDILSGKPNQPRHVGGRIIKQPAPYNPPWSFHLDPPTIEFFDNAIEVCDASIAYVESFLDEAGGAFLPGNYWCPWGSQLLREIPAPNPGSGLSNVSAASFKRVGLAAEAIVAAFGANLAARTEAAEALPLPTVLAGTTVKIKDALGVERFAPLFFVSPAQVNYLVPLGTEPGLATVTVSNASGATVTEGTQVLLIAPGLFTANGNGQGVPTGFALRQRVDGSQRFEPLARYDEAQRKFVPVELALGPAGEQVFLVLFGSGLRRAGLDNNEAKLGGLITEVVFAGGLPEFAGLDQVNLRVPRELAGRGEVNVELLLDDRKANLVTVNFK